MSPITKTFYYLLMIKRIFDIYVGIKFFKLKSVNINDFRIKEIFDCHCLAIFGFSFKNKIR